MAQERGAVIAGLVEDTPALAPKRTAGASVARFYAKSQQLADMDQVAVQKDPWHVQRDGSRVRLFLEKAAYRVMSQVLQLEKRLAKAWDDTLFEQYYLPAVMQEEQAIAHHDAFAAWLGHLYDALAWFIDRCMKLYNLRGVEHAHVRVLRTKAAPGGAHSTMNCQTRMEQIEPRPLSYPIGRLPAWIARHSQRTQDLPFFDQSPACRWQRSGRLPCGLIL
jgi:hypothetical protein